MIRSALVAVLFLVTSLVSAADLPKDIGAEARAVWVKKWQPTYAAERDRLKKEIQEAEPLVKFPTTATAAKAKIAACKELLDVIQRRPWSVKDAPVDKFKGDAGSTGDIGLLPQGEYVAVAVLPEGTHVEALSEFAGEKVILRYLVASPLPKKVKKDSQISLPGMWYVAGTAEVKGKTATVVYKFELKKEDYPAEKK